jgi:hypothetical protein
MDSPSGGHLDVEGRCDRREHSGGNEYNRSHPLLGTTPSQTEGSNRFVRHSWLTFFCQQRSDAVGDGVADGEAGGFGGAFPHFRIHIVDVLEDVGGHVSGRGFFLVGRGSARGRFLGDAAGGINHLLDRGAGWSRVSHGVISRLLRASRCRTAGQRRRRGADRLRGRGRAGCGGRRFGREAVSWCSHLFRGRCAAWNA